MQRQSLGSPGSKLRSQEIIGGGGGGGGNDDVLVVKADDQSRRISSSTSSCSINSSIATPTTDDDEIKLDKLHRPSSIHNYHHNLRKREKFIHLIPILTIVCFLILYLSSHEPSQNDLAGFNGFRHPSEQQQLLDSTVNIEDSMRFIDRGEILGIRSLRNLQEIGKKENSSTTTESRNRSHRKFGNF